MTNNTTNNTTLNLTNTTDSQQEYSTKSQSSVKSSSKSDDDDGYEYSAQYGAEIKYWTDSDGIGHMHSRDGQWEGIYNERTGEITEKSPYDGWTTYYVNV